MGASNQAVTILIRNNRESIETAWLYSRWHYLNDTQQFTRRLCASNEAAISNAMHEYDLSAGNLIAEQDVAASALAKDGD